MKLPRRLAAHLRRWQKAGEIWPVTHQGQRVADIKTAFAAASLRAGLEDLTPHSLKHTAITWAMQRGMQIDDAASHFGASRETIIRSYWPHSYDVQKDAVAVMDRNL